MKVFLFLLILLTQTILSNGAVVNKDSLFFFNSNLVFVPTESSIFESRIGMTKFTDKKLLELDIGASLDLIGYKAGQNTFSFGVDFFTFSSLRSEANFKFPVDAIDYLFGVNFNYKNNSPRKNPATFIHSLRLRIAHISSHFEDGHIYERTDTIFTPVVYSKEFINLAAVKEIALHNKVNLKGLIALDYIFHSIPKSISKLSGQLGMETRYFISDFVSVYLSNDLTLANVNSITNLNENFEGGVSFGGIKKRSINVYFTYYDGQDYRGQYYGKYLNFKGLGIGFKI
ncbi:MAG: DUF1207 domain-containing protein [Bacteroidota bacterium]|nr:DUF1207 domain-containing protein [Bacteroidota bacterium]